LSSDFVAGLGLPAPRNADHEATRSMLLAEVLLGAESGQGVSYSRRKVFYADGRRYRSRAYTYTAVMRSVDELVQHGLLHEHRVAPNNRGWQSSIWATPDLLDVASAYHAELNFHAGEPIRLKDAAGKLVDYAETRQTWHLRRGLEPVNASLKELRIELTGAERRGRHLCIGDTLILPLPGNGLHRIFSRGSFKFHGRAYGWWQNIPRKVRPDLMIDGEPTAEADYAALHATMLYCRRGLKLDDDPYEIADIPRDHVKQGFNIALNAPDRRSALYALADRAQIGATDADRLLVAVEHRHKSISDAFFSDAGIRLMRDDSDMILSAVSAANERGVVALPIHDALVVQARHSDVAAEVMVEAFEKIVGRANPCHVKIKQARQM
jgi:hypothetical protein